ncbi:hypothetical protein MUB24_00735 [Lederbergia sp. NSJ-179]|uniref:hypothetical protein n=1 Tax=Lederbergia sp. NSJ-179 TaxID=2931402 RepID=UPI001FD2D512|nr:hypothetical protein [Lederbergia sp. NSJ-179]MCJ7839453.1 hypothetical protein [Lederbergia sp. NSJ-179]
MKFYVILPLSFIFLFLLTGCMYPNEKKAENQIPYEDQLASVQKAVHQFQEEKDGILPIKTRDQDTPKYIKYPIDFSKIVPEYLSSPPGNSFENGGIFQYILIDVETNPTVKLVDLRIAEKIRELKIRIQSQGYPPFKDTLANNVYTLDFSKLGYKEEPYVTSPFSHQNLSFIVDGQGEVYIDYISDLYQVLKEEKNSFQQGDNIIDILAEDSPFVPAYSMPYTIDENNEPIYMSK